MAQQVPPQPKLAQRPGQRLPVLDPGAVRRGDETVDQRAQRIVGDLFHPPQPFLQRAFGRILAQSLACQREDRPFQRLFQKAEARDGVADGQGHLVG